VNSVGVTIEQLKAVNVLLGTPQRPLMKLAPKIISRSNPETPEEIRRLKKALAVISSNSGRGNGSINLEEVNPAGPANYWLGVVWAIRGLNWQCGEQIARNWSVESFRYTDEGFDSAWNDYDPSHANPIGIGSVYKLASVFNSPSFDPFAFTQYHATAALPALSDPTRYKLLDGDHLRALPPRTWCVKGIFPSTGLAAIFGQSGSGKSFLALDLAAAIAEGVLWFGFRTTKTPTVYMALEGEGGFSQRVAAWEKVQKKPLPPLLNMIMQPFQLAQPHDVTDLAAVIPQGAVVIVDTLNRAAPTADENSSRDMGIILEATKRLQTLTGCLVVLIHHTGKDTRKGLRGHSSLGAALDGSIEVSRTGDSRAWSSAKVKDNEDDKRFPFKLKRHVLGTDADGDELSSCTVERDCGLLFQVPEPTGRDQKHALNVFKTVINQSAVTNKAGCGEQTQCIKVEDAVLDLARTLTTARSNQRNNRARKIIQDLVLGGHLRSELDGDEGWLWLP
jgi:hypothetical protein